MFCTKCGKEFDGAFCPVCGTPKPDTYDTADSQQPLQRPFPAKKRFYKRWWFWLIVVVFLGFALLGGSDNTEENPGTDLAEQEETDGSANTKLTSQTDAADDLVIEENDSGQVSLEDLTTAQIYSLISDYADDMPFTISDKANIFLDEHSDLFPAVSKEAVIPFVDSTIEYRMVEKNPDNFGDKVFSLDSAYVTKITESSDENSSLSLTELQVADYDVNSFYIFYLGNLEDIYANDIVSVYGLPIGMTSFSNQGGGTTSAVVLAGCYIEKQQ